MSDEYAAVLPEVVAAVHAAGDRLREEFASTRAPLTRDGVYDAIHRIDQKSLAVLRPRLAQARPGAGWVEDELDDGPLPAGEWWVIDPAEGAINHVQGIREWATSATLVRDNEPVLTVVYVPLEDATYTATRGHGAFHNGTRLRVSAKTEFRAALVGTGQASPRESTETFELIGRTLAAMMGAAGLTRSAVPSTLQLIHVAAARMDLFWQHSAVRSGLLAGALLVQEAGGTVTAIDGQPWSLHSRDFLAAAPGVHEAAVDLLMTSLADSPMPAR
ncbi:inositol monophosphatase family protein [uncultured Jatrophihabitans sp.]|uniref:inositol monophosphatase family protein n=1 Tax=uncultured Jatrophihabitans sp. TaxID=1610747 RepID=UPI0035CC9492